MTELELYHHGILGQKWGIRRFQKKDGSLTSAGRKRVKDLYQESRDDKQGKKPPAEDKTKAEELYEKVKPTSELTNEELEYAIRRVQLERAYNELYAPKTPEQKSFVQKLNASKDKIAAVAGVLEGAVKVGTATLAVAKLFGYKTKDEKKKEAKEAAEKATKAARDAWEFEEKKNEAYRKQYAFDEGIKEKRAKAEREAWEFEEKKKEAAGSREQARSTSEYAYEAARDRAEEARARARADAGRADSREKARAAAEDAANDFFSSSRTKSYADSGRQTTASIDDIMWDVPFRDVTGFALGLPSPK